MGAALDWIAAQAATPDNPAGNLIQGRAMLVESANTCAAMTRAAATAMGFQLFAPKGHEAAAATAIVPPKGTDSGIIVKGLRSKFAAIVTDGQGEMKGSLFRIAHIGFFDYLDTIAIIGALEQVCVAAKLPLANLAFGTGLIAAQKVYAERTGSPSDSSSAASQESVLVGAK
jgi:aspartate aminotransferase-like enzyme